MLGERIASIRKAKPGLTQERLAAAAGVRQSHISRIESGDIKNVRGDILAKIAQALGVSADYLLGLGDEDAEADYPRVTPRRTTTKAAKS
jgi:transcriptional regulator with XRE-family HTH domain